mmetsp:Transcript_120686/g.286714  ORF Transcript_120686/g.286714 Transcript_120686/m.286714 type:complete len:348 (-) Transcript_120686:141-1184(-)
MPSKAGTKSVAMRWEAAEVNSGEPVVRIDFSHCSMTSLKVCLSSPTATEMWEHIADSTSSSFWVKVPLWSFLLMTEITPCTSPPLKTGIHSMLCTVMPVFRKLSWSSGSYIASSLMSAMLIKFPECATWPMTPWFSFQWKEGGRFGDWCEETNSSLSLFSSSSPTASAWRISCTLEMTISKASSRSLSRRCCTAALGSITSKGQHPRMQPMVIPMNWPMFFHRMVMGSSCWASVSLGSSNPNALHLDSSHWPDQMPAPSLIVLPIAAAAIVLKFRATHSVLSIRSPNTIIRKLSRNPNPMKGTAAACRHLCSCSLVGSEETEVPSLEASTLAQLRLGGNGNLAARPM